MRMRNGLYAEKTLHTLQHPASEPKNQCTNHASTPTETLQERLLCDLNANDVPIRAAFSTRLRKKPRLPGLQIQRHYRAFGS
jgi:hypothetical protein